MNSAALIPVAPDLVHGFVHRMFLISAPGENKPGVAPQAVGKYMGVSAAIVMAMFIGVVAPPIVQAGEPSRGCPRANRYSVLPLPFTPRLITSSGVVAGITELRHAVVWHRGSGVEALSIPNGFAFTEPVAVMPSGEILVNALDATGHTRAAFTYSEHRFVALPGKQTWAHGASAPNMIVGEGVSEGGTITDAVYWSDTVPHSIGLCCGGILKAVNEGATMIGDAYDDHGHYHAFSWSPAEGQRNLDPEHSYSSAVAVNRGGHILLQVSSEAYLYDSGHLSHLDLDAKLYNSVQAMNNCDDVVGGYGPFADRYRAFLWSRARGFQELNALIPADSGWQLVSAAAINDRGEIVGSGKWHGDKRGFLLTPRR